MFMDAYIPYKFGLFELHVKIIGSFKTLTWNQIERLIIVWIQKQNSNGERTREGIFHFHRVVKSNQIKWNGILSKPHTAFHYRRNKSTFVDFNTHFLLI